MNVQNFAHILKILTPAQKRASVLLVFFMSVGMILETIGVGAIIPLIALIGDKQILNSYPVLVPVVNFLGNPSHELLCIYAVSGLVAIYLVKQCFLAYSIHRESDFSFGLQESLSKRLFTIYMHQPYTFHLQKNSAELIQNILSEVNILVFKVIWPGLRIVSEVFLLFFISLLLFSVEPLGAILVAAFFFTLAVTFHHTTKSKISSWGKQRQVHESKVVQHLQQGLGGIKDATILGRESHFIEHFSVHNTSRVQIGRNETMTQHYPKLWIEFFSILGLAIIVWVMIYQGKPVAKIVPTIGVFAAAAFRLMPSVNRLITSIQSIRFGTPIIPHIFKEFQLPFFVPESMKSEMIAPKKVQVKNLQYSYPASQLDALNGVSLEFKAGDSIGIIGESGSGKSTLVDCILGLLTPKSGVIEVDGKNIHGDLRNWQNKIGYVSQAIFLSDDTMRRNIAYGLPDNEIDEEKVSKALKLSQLDKFIQTLPDGLDTFVGERGIRLSGGQRQRIGIARALYNDPKVLVLDEATSALDVATEREVMRVVYELNSEKALIIIAHRLATVAECKRIYHMMNGKIIEEGRPEDILSKMEITSKIN